MCTVTLLYDQNNALARRKLADLLRTGLFVQKDIETQTRTEAEEEEHRKEVEAFIHTSKTNMANIISRYL